MLFAATLQSLPPTGERDLRMVPYAADSWYLLPSLFKDARCMMVSMGGVYIMIRVNTC